MSAAEAIGRRWHPLRPHPAHARLVRSKARFDVTEAGRRSGKTELPKRLGVIEAVAMGPQFTDRGLTWYTKYCAPTHDQARKIYWDDLKALSQPWWARDPRESDLFIYLRGGAQIWVCGLDKPQRVEGSPVDRLAVDELADVKDGAWDRHLYPALGTPGRPPGRAWLYGVPRPGGQFSELVRRAKDPNEPDYAYHTWSSEGIVSDEVWRAAMRGKDAQMFAQEWRGERVSTEGRAYYSYAPDKNARRLSYDPTLPLLFCFDFNRSPGVAVVAQEQALDGLVIAQCPRCGKNAPGLSGSPCAHCNSLLPLETSSCAIGEVHIPTGSNTTMVCTRLCGDWGHHKGRVICFGDATGAAKKSSSIDGSDWDLIRRYLQADFPQAEYDVDRANPAARVRVNAMNLRACNAAGERRMFVDTVKAPNLARDMEDQLVVVGGSGELDKDSDKTIGHAADGWGYCIQKLYPADFDEFSSIESV